jgi:GTPase SAR1 family protein
MTSIIQPKKRNVPVGSGGIGRAKPEKTSANYFIKLLLLGDTGVGKSSLMFRFSEGEFKCGLIGTAGVDYKMKNIELNGKSVKI